VSLVEQIEKLKAEAQEAEEYRRGIQQQIVRMQRVYTAAMQRTRDNTSDFKLTETEQAELWDLVNMLIDSLRTSLDYADSSLPGFTEWRDRAVELIGQD
jgi:hypothetical protein